MGTFDPHADTPFQLKTEAETITLSMKQGVPTASSATMKWNIPTPALGCDNDGVYSGMVILLSTKPLTADHIPQDGNKYIADNTANVDVHAGDTINDALVVGAFYECDKKGAGLPLTTSMVINDLDPDVGYYVGGYATDCQHRYHSDGIRAYSDHYGDTEGEHFPASQIIEVKTTAGDCIIPTDGTGLLPNVEYKFDLVIDNTYPKGTDLKVVEYDINGTYAGTYEDLLLEINKGIAIVDNPPQSPVAPNAGQLYWNVTDQTLFQFDGTTHSQIPVLIEPTDPSDVTSGDYWYDPVTKVLSRWDLPTPTGWNAISFMETTFNPVAPSCNSYWIDNTIGRKWNGTIWCDFPTTIQNEDPRDCNIPPCGAWWYDETNLQLNEWNVNLLKWDARTALYWHEAPNQLANGTYWFNITSETLNILNGAVWDDITANTNVYIQTEEPINKVTGVLWYSKVTEELQEYDGNTGLWTVIPVIVWAVQPDNVESCDAWWRSTDDELLLWDAISATWIVVAEFSVSNVDPIFPSNLDIGHIWYNPTSNITNIWDGGAWVATEEFVISLTDPRTPIAEDGWFNPDTGIWNIWDTQNPGWNEINPADISGDPSLIPTGTYWYDTMLAALNIRNGLVWLNVIYSTTPLTPKVGSLWFNSSTNTLLEWSGSSYTPASLTATAAFGDCGITITSTQTGSSTFVMIPVMNSPACTASGFADFTVDGASPNTTCGHLGSGGLTKAYPVRHLTYAESLWDQIKDTARMANPVIGADGVSGKTSYDTLGVGDDGTPDERRELAYSIRAQLGYPVVEVELTPYQLDTAIQGALESFRKRSSMAYRRGFYFLDIQPQQQNYVLTNKQIGYDKIVSITSAYRFTSAFLSTAHGGGVYGQVVLQHLYNMGTYDLTSFHLVSQYVEQLQDLFATRLVYNWNEKSRQLGFYQSFTSPERVLLDCSIERTEQDLMTDRFAKTWIERYALAESMTMLARIRGKYGSLPGAGGGISLDAADLMATAETYRQDLITQLDDFVVQDMEGVGMNSSFIFGG